MNIPTLNVSPRERAGASACRRLRRQGLVPAVLYGRGEPNLLLAVPDSAMEKLLRQHNVIMNLQWDDKNVPAQLKEVQYNALGDEVIHADFGRISLTETVQVRVRVELHGEAAGVKEGGVLDQVLHELTVECLPTGIPDKVRVEVSPLTIGADLRVRDLIVPEGVKVLADPDAVVVTCVYAMEIEEAAEAAAEATVEPEVIGRVAPLEGEEAGEEGKAE